MQVSTNMFTFKVIYLQYAISENKVKMDFLRGEQGDENFWDRKCMLIEGKQLDRGKVISQKKPKLFFPAIQIGASKYQMQ